MEALKEWDTRELLRRQEMLDAKFDKKSTVRKRTGVRIKLAAITELGELCQELKDKWNYWKNSIKPTDTERALEELSDFLHFVLSYINEMGEEIDEDYLKEIIDAYAKGSQVDAGDVETLLWRLWMFFYEREYGILLAYVVMLANQLGATTQYFLKVHHRVWQRNMGVRSREEY